MLLSRPRLVEGTEVSVILSFDEGHRMSVQMSRYPRAELARLEAELEHLVRMKQLAPLPISRSLGPQLAAVAFDGGWKRAIVVTTMGPRSAKVWMADYGFEYEVARQQLRELPHDLADRLPAYGVRV